MKRSRSLFHAPGPLGATFPSPLAAWMAALLAGPAGAQIPEFQSLGDAWDRIPVVDPPPPAHPFLDSVALSLDENGILDVAVLWNEQVYWLADPGRRKVSSLVPASGVVDLEAFHPGLSERDALVTAGASGVEIWEWDAGAGSLALRATVQGTWPQAARIAAHELASIHGAVPWTVLAIWDASAGSLSLELVRPNASGGYDQAHLTTFPAGLDVTAVALLDFAGSSLPEVAVGSSTGLQIHGPFGQLIAAHAGGTEGLAPCGLDSGGHERLAWVRHDAASGTRLLRVLHDGGAEADVFLASSAVESLGFHEERDQSFLVADVADESILIFEAQDPPNSTFSLAASDKVFTTPSPACPLLRDLDLVECSNAVDLLVFHDVLGEARIHRGMKPDAPESAYELLVDLEHEGFYSSNGEGDLAVEGPAVLLTPFVASPEPAEKVRVNVFAWEEVLDPAWGALVASNEGEAGEPLLLQLAFPGETPPGLIFEVIVRSHVGGRLVARETAYLAMVDADSPLAPGLVPGSCDSYVDADPSSGETPRGVTPIPGQCKPGQCN